MSFQNKTVNRRAFIGTAATVATAMAASQVHAGGHEHESAHGDHAHGHASPVSSKLQHAAMHCVGIGRECIAHCNTEFAAGRTELAACAGQVAQLVAACDAISALAAHNSDHLRDFAAATAKVCKDCKAECMKHVDHHSICQRCAHACEECLEACEAVTSA
ncbi:MAG: hypothetical protein Tsb002_09960 [Wenzhouxiangellaceae bacterium]